MTRYYCQEETPKDIPWKRTGEKIEFMFPAFLKSRWWGTSTPLYRRELSDRNGAWLALSQEEDWEYDCRMASLGVRLHYCHDFVSNERDHGNHRLSRAGSNNPILFKHRAEAHILIYQHACKGNINHSMPEMQHFARELFLLSRKCGAFGLDYESRKLFYLSIAASGVVRGNGWDFRLYALLARVFGWTKTGKAACFADRFRV